VTFGPTAAQVDAATGAELGAIVTELLAPAAPPEPPDLGPDPAGVLRAVLPPLLAGAKSAGATVPGGAVQLPKTVTTALLTSFGQVSAGEPPAQARAAACFADLVRVQDLLNKVEVAWDFG
jgi:hypothetical protein